MSLHSFLKMLPPDELGFTKMGNDSRSGREAAHRRSASRAPAVIHSLSTACSLGPQH